MNITFIRHGNADKETSEDGDLTKKGIKQAKALAKRLKKKRIDEFYCSDMKRAKQTSKIVAKKIKLEPKIDSRLNEFKTEMLNKKTSSLNKDEKQKLQNLRKFLRDIADNPNQRKNILIISHGITNRIILSHFIGISLQNSLFFRQRETGINQIYWIEKFNNWRVKVWNDICHVPKRLR